MKKFFQVFLMSHILASLILFLTFTLFFMPSIAVRSELQKMNDKTTENVIVSE